MDTNPSLSWNISVPLPKVRGDSDVGLSTKNIIIWNLSIIRETKIKIMSFESYTGTKIFLTRDIRRSKLDN